MHLSETLPATWYLFVQWIAEDPERAQKVGLQFIERVLADPKLVKELQAIMASAHPGGEKIEVKPEVKPKKAARAKKEKAVLDPIELAREGEAVLREKLAGLTLVQIKTILSEYALDPSAIVSRKRSVSPMIDFIVTVSLSRAHKGEAFKV